MKKIVLAIILSMGFNFAHAGNVTHLEEEELVDILLKDKKDKILIFFTTWCTYCKPITLSKTLPQDKIVFISLDTDKEVIEEFSKKMIYDVYHITPTEDMENLVSLSKSLGITFATENDDGGVDMGFPYIAHLDKNNKVITDGIDSENLEKYLK